MHLTEDMGLKKETCKVENMRHMINKDGACVSLNITSVSSLDSMLQD